jgi:general L-amino acid transport system substrate-binding protein
MPLSLQSSIRFIRTQFATALAVGLLVLCAKVPGAHAGAVLDGIRAKGLLTCGVSGDAPGLSSVDGKGRRVGFEADLCRAFAAAVLGDGTKAEFRPIDTIEDFLGDSRIDIVVHGLTWTYGREVGRGLRFGPVVLYDGQAFLVQKALGASSIGDLSGRTICVPGDGAFLQNFERTFHARDIPYKALVLNDLPEAADAFFRARKCAALTADASELAGALIARRAATGRFAVLPDRISKEPLAPVLRRGDGDFFDVVRWTVFALIDAEELGVTSTNVDSARVGGDPRAEALLRGAPGSPLALDRTWVRNVVHAVGNYGEIFDRNLGRQSAADLPRGLNDLWSRGGLMIAPPFR